MTSTPEAVSARPAKRVPVILSTSSVYPESTTAAFEIAANLGYDGVEVMVWTDGASQDSRTLSRLADHYGVPVLAVHSPCLLVTQRVWSSDPWERLRRSLVMAQDLEAPTVVLHPPFIWQREYARGFRAGIERFLDEFPKTQIAVENMYPVRMARREFIPYAPHWDPTTVGFQRYTLDSSHCAAARTDALEMAEKMGDAIGHVHLGDGNGEGRDEHLVPGRGSQPCGPVLEYLVSMGYTGAVSVEVNTRKAGGREGREAALEESLAFARKHLAAASAASV